MLKILENSAQEMKVVGRLSPKMPKKVYSIHMYITQEEEEELKNNYIHTYYIHTYTFLNLLFSKLYNIHTYVCMPTHIHTSTYIR